MNVIAQVLGFSAIGISLFVYSRKKREHILSCKLAQDVLWATHYCLLGAYSAMATNLICAARECTFYNQSSRIARSRIITAAFISFYLLSALLTWKNVFSIFPALSSTFSTLAFRMKDPIKIKLLAIPSSLCTLVYNVTTSHSVSVYIGISITLTTICFSLAEAFISKRKENKTMSKEKIKIAIIGCGRFAKNFVPLFKAHPEVEKVVVCDLIRERAEEYSKNFGVDIIDSFEEALSSKDINSVAIFTQRFKHGEMVISALKAGKHVYSAVPCSISIDEIKEIERLVRQTRLTYSMGETGFYRAPAILCRKLYKEGHFGQFVYGEAQYNHDIRNMEASFRSSGGEDWKKYAGIPPMFYPTHSTAMILSAMPGVYVTAVSAQGYKSAQTDIYGSDGQNLYDNPFANTAMLVKLSNGGVARISENRNLGWKAPETYISQFYGTNGCYEYSIANHYLTSWDPDKKGSVIIKNINDMMFPESIVEQLKTDFDAGIQAIADGAGFRETSPIQKLDQLPESYKELPNGHNGTHQYLIDDFCRAYATGKLSPTNIWAVARYNIPGLIAHQSALRGGELMQVPDLGDPPADWEVLEPKT